jgi:hypothetical protein
MQADTPNEFINYQYKGLCMTWLAENWFWVLFGVAFVAMHLFGHDSHGSHSGHGSHGGSGGGPPKKEPDEPGVTKRPNRTDAHRH